MRHPWAVARRPRPGRRRRLACPPSIRLGLMHGVVKNSKPNPNPRRWPNASPRLHPSPQPTKQPPPRRQRHGLRHEPQPPGDSAQTQAPPIALPAPRVRGEPEPSRSSFRPPRRGGDCRSRSRSPSPPLPFISTTWPLLLQAPARTGTEPHTQTQAQALEPTS